MAACVQVNQAQGYQCAFVGQVDEDFYCKKCKLVARSLTFASCCGESFCLTCIETCKEEGKPCPKCNKMEYSVQQQVKFQRRISNLEVQCSLRDKGCEWQGALKELAPHVDPDQDNCQYVEIKCPLNCQQLVPKNQMKTHVNEKCVKRDFFCQHCNYKASYEEVTNEHLPQCKYMPITCPNHCGVVFEREDLEDHMKICRLEEIRCDFEKVGCDTTLSREELDGHLRNDNHKHLLKMATLAAENKSNLEKGMEDLRKEYTEVIEKMSGKVRAQEERISEQHKMIESQKKDFEDHKVESKKEMEVAIAKCYATLDKRLRAQEDLTANQEKDFKEALLKLKKEILDSSKEVKAEVEKSCAKEREKLKTQVTDLSQKLKACEEKLKKQEYSLALQKQNMEKLEEGLSARIDDKTMSVDNNAAKIKALAENLPKMTEMYSYLGNFERSFEMKEFSKEKEKDKPRDWKSPPMYTHICGYRFCIGMDANGRGGSHGKALYAELYVMPGEYDSLLKWPAKASFTLELVHQKGGANVKYNTAMKKWDKPELNFKCLSVFPFTEVNNSYCFMEHAQLEEFVANDTLKFSTSVTLH